MAEFKFPCPQCGQGIQYDSDYSGTQINCPICKQAIVVPQAVGVSPAPAKSRTLRNVLVIVALVVVLAGLLLGGWRAYSQMRIRSKQTHLPSGLVALWSGEGNAKDSAGAHNGELTGSTTYEEGKLGKAFSLDGTRGSSVNVGNPVQLQLQDFTITTWIKRDNADSVSADFP